jgi:hypothetical protein
MSDGNPNRSARERQHERAEHVEQVLDAVEQDMEAIRPTPTTSPRSIVARRSTW